MRHRPLPALHLIGPRSLSDVERSVTTKILLASAEVVPLLSQLAAARVGPGSVTFLDLTVPANTPRVDLPDGPLPVSAVADDADGRPLGELIVWIEDGRLSALEYAWVGDEPPREWPAPENISIEA